MASIHVNNQQIDDPNPIKKEVFKHVQKLYSLIKTLKLEDINCGIPVFFEEIMFELESPCQEDEVCGGYQGV